LEPSILLLLVEDEALIRMNLEEDLGDAGFTLVVAANGVEAMAELEADATRFRAVLTDIRFLPGPNGWEVARRARELVPHVPVVYMSGDSAHEWNSQGVPSSIMVAKPFVGAQIITAITTLLNEAGGQSH
jgi:DNA-binding response OmpR family regulator